MRFVTPLHTVLAVAAGLLGGAATTGVAVAQPTAPNGPIAFTRVIPGDAAHGGLIDDHQEIFTMDARGGHRHRLTHAPRDRFAPLSSYDPAFSPDGSRIAFTSNRHDGWSDDIYVMNADGTHQTRLSAASRAYAAQPSFSPDGKSIAFVSDRGSHQAVYVMRADGHDPRLLAYDDTTDLYHPSFSPDGTRIVFADAAGIAVVQADGTGRIQLVAEPPDSDDVDDEPAFSPDGRRIVFTSGDGLLRLDVVNADGSGRTRLLRAGRPGESPAFSPDGTRVVYTDDNEGDETVGAFLRVHDIASGADVRVPPRRRGVRAPVGDLAPRWGTVPSPSAVPLRTATPWRRVRVPSTGSVQRAVVRSRAARRIRLVEAECEQRDVGRWRCQVGAPSDGGEDDPPSYRCTVTASARGVIRVGRLLREGG